MFIDIIFSDSTGVITGKLWDLVEEYRDRFQKGDPVAVKGKITNYNDTLQLTVSQINKATKSQYSKYGFSNNILIKQIKESTDELWENIITIINSLDCPYRDVIYNIYKENEKKIKSIPMSIDDVEIVRGSFLKSLFITSNILLNILHYYPNINKNLVISGLLLQNIGKIRCINDDLQVSYTDEGILVGYKNLGIEILQQAVTATNNIPKDILLQLEHVILHSNTDDISSNIKVQLPEVLFIKYISKLDMEVNNMCNFMDITSQKS